MFHLKLFDCSLARPTNRTIWSTTGLTGHRDQFWKKIEFQIELKFFYRNWTVYHSDRLNWCKSLSSAFLGRPSTANRIPARNIVSANFWIFCHADCSTCCEERRSGVQTLSSFSPPQILSLTAVLQTFILKISRTPYYSSSWDVPILLYESLKTLKWLRNDSEKL